MEPWRSGKRGVQNRAGSAPRTAWVATAFVLTFLAGCRPSEPARTHSVAHTAPELLHDGDEIRAYVNAFPVDEYAVHEVPGIGRFYIDHANERIKKAIVEGRVWEQHVVDLLEEHLGPGDVAIDIGAHIGMHTVKMSALVGAKGKVYAFEPVRKTYRELSHNLSLNGSDNVVPLRFALGSGPARLIEMNPLVEKNESGTRVGSGGDAVELRSLDSFGFRACP